MTLSARSVGVVLAALLVSSACGAKEPRPFNGTAILEAGEARSPAAGRKSEAAAQQRAAAQKRAAAAVAQAGSAAGPATSAGDPLGPRSAPGHGGNVRLGVRYLDAESVKTAGQLFGLSGADVGEPQRYAEILIKHLNASGGLAGRTIEPVYHGVDAVELALSSAAAEEGACRALTEDAKVFAIVSAGPTNQAFPDCTTKKKVPVVNVSYNYYPASVMKKYGPYFYFPTSMDSDRSHRTIVDGLLDEGFFASGFKLGIVRLNTDVHEQVLRESLKPALARRGLRVHEEVALRNAQDQEGFASAVLRFNQAGVTNVMFIESAGQLALGFTQRAEDQGYRPRYGFSSHASMLGIALNTPPAQLRRSVGVGWIPASDAVGAKGAELGPQGRWCIDLMRRGGETADTEGAIAVALWTCDVLLFLKAGLDRAPSFTAAGLAQSIVKLKDSFRPASTWATLFPGGRRDGASRVRRFAYEETCRCFRWRGATYPAD